MLFRWSFFLTTGKNTSRGEMAHWFTDDGTAAIQLLQMLLTGVAAVTHLQFDVTYTYTPAVIRLIFNIMPVLYLNDCFKSIKRIKYYI